MDLLLAAITCGKGDLDGNLTRHLGLLDEAATQGCGMVVFPEMSLTGSVEPRTQSERLVDLAHPAVRAVVKATGTVAAVFGVAEAGPYITQVAAAGGEVVAVQRKRHLGEGEEGFLAGTGDAVFGWGGVGFGIAICAEAGFDAPFDAAGAAGAGAVVFCAAPGLYGRRTDEASWRSGWDWWVSCGLADAKRHAARQSLWIAMATQAGSTEDEDFPGGAALIDPTGNVVAGLDHWREATLKVTIPA